MNTIEKRNNIKKALLVVNLKNIQKVRIKFKKIMNLKNMKNNS